MDEVIEQIRQACTGKSVEEIAAEIRQSRFAERDDVDQLAAFFASLCE